MEPKNKGTLIHQSATHRLVSKGKYSSGYEDLFVIEIREQDALGNERWSAISEIDGTKTARDSHDAHSVLISMVKELAAANRRAT